MRKKMIWLSAVILWLAVIFWFSAQPAKESSSMSDGIAYRIVVQTDQMLHLNWTQSQLERYAENIHYPIRKAAHMTEYAILAILIWNYLGTTSLALGRRSRGGLCELLVVFYAATDEFHQRFVPGRSGEIRDVCIDATGALIALLLIGCLAMTANRGRTERIEKEK